MGEYTAAVRYIQWCIANFGTDDITLAIYCIRMATTYKELGEYEDALAYMRKSAPFFFQKGKSGPVAGYYLNCFYYSLGLIYLGRKEYYIAIYIFQKLLEQWKDVTKEVRLITKDIASEEGWEWLSTWEGNSDELAKAYNNLGFVYMSLKQYHAAYHYLSKGVELQLKCLPQKYYHLAVSFINLGRLNQYLMDYHNALKYFTKAVDILKVSRRPNHASTMDIYTRIGEVYELQCDYPMALESYQNAFNHATEISEIIKQLVNIVRMYNKMKQHKQAIEVSERAAQLCREHSLSITLIFAKKDNVMLYK